MIMIYRVYYIEILDTCISDQLNLIMIIIIICTAAADDDVTSAKAESLNDCVSHHQSINPSPSSSFAFMCYDLHAFR